MYAICRILHSSSGNASSSLTADRCPLPKRLWFSRQSGTLSASDRIRLVSQPTSPVYPRRNPMSTREELISALHHGVLSRREFVRRMSALGVAAGAAPAFLSGTARAAEPKRGGRITVGVEAAQTKDSLDPTKYYSTANILMGFTVYDSLVNRGPDLKPVPWLAESWEVGADASEWIFQLAQGRGMARRFAVHRRRRDLHVPSAQPRGFRVAGQGVHESDRGDDEGRRPRRPVQAERAERRFPHRPLRHADADQPQRLRRFRIHFDRNRSVQGQGLEVGIAVRVRAQRQLLAFGRGRGWTRSKCWGSATSPRG